MIWHFLEVWLLLFAAFIVGCGLGALTYRGLAASRLAEAQDAATELTTDAVDRVRALFGRAPIVRTVPPPEPWPGGYEQGGGFMADDARTSESADQVFAAPSVSATDHVGPDSGLDIGREAGLEGRPIGLDGAEAAIDPVEKAAMIDAARALPTSDLRDAEPAMPALPDLPATRPAMLDAPRNGIADDLRRIRGIGRKNEALLNALGVFHYGQVAAWTPAEARWVAQHLAFPDRLFRDDWIGQATILASGGRTGYVRQTLSDDAATPDR